MAKKSFEPQVRRHRYVEVNEGFLQQIADLDHKLKWIKNNKETKN